MSLAGRVAIVTGSTTGIGFGIAKCLAKEGANVLINGFGDSAPALTAVRAMGVACEHHPADLTDVAQVEDMMSFAAKRLGPVDIVINNAGIQHVASVETFPVAMWDKVLALNLSAAFHTTRLAVPAMKERNWGRIINVASVHGCVGSVQKSAYVAAKHGIQGLTKVTALELAETGVTCNSICPGWVLTPLVEAQIAARAEKLNMTFDEARASLLKEKQPSGKFVTPEQLGALAVFLCSENGSEVRGASWNMDGGWLAQ
eukprot:PhM_4_TR10549/c0_g1_i1/m.79626/K00019/E1.1.1.30, bdh; 3-hydroxybutyrate dehydrogenase